QAYLSFLYRMIFNKQNADIEVALDEFRKINEYSERIPFVKRFEIRDLKKNEDAISKVVELEEQLNVDYYSTIVHSHSSFALQAWLWFLFSQKELDLERLNIYSNKLNLRYDHIEDLLNDIVIINDESHYGYLELGRWDYTERPDGEVYSPPQPHEWLTQGVVIYMLRSFQSSNIDFTLIPNNREFYFMYGAVKGIIQEIRNNFLEWNDVLVFKNMEEFDEHSRIVNSIFSQLRRRYVSIEEQEIANLSISTALIEKFQNLVYNAWLKNSKIKSLFEHFKNVTKISDDTFKFHDYNTNTFFAKAKTMFTDKNYQHIYGVEDMGAGFGRTLDNQFFNVVMPKQNIKQYSSVTLAIDDFIKGLTFAKHLPDLIVMPPEFISIEELKKNIKFIPRWEIKDRMPDINIIGFYDNIPIISTYSGLMKNKLMVCSFIDAFQLEIGQDENFVGKELDISVQEVNDEIARRKLNQDRGKWMKDDDGNILTEEEAIILIKTSVIIKIAIKANFVVKNPGAYLVAEIDKKTIDEIGI
ncbi:MAG: hypothetical protein ACXVHS_11125, partial [Methanobacterium sp.]